MSLDHGYCVDCQRYKSLRGRHLCSYCYGWHFDSGTLEQFPRSTWKNADLMAELDFFRQQGLTVRQAAEKIGVKLSALRRAIQRAKDRQPAAGT